MFKLTPKHDTTGITLMGEIEVVPALIVRCFGSPAKGDGYKISGEYIFIDHDENPFVVHDWKSTNLWDKRLPDPEEFWLNTDLTELNISSRDLDIEEFRMWFLGQLREMQNPQAH